MKFNPTESSKILSQLNRRMIKCLVCGNSEASKMIITDEQIQLFSYEIQPGGAFAGPYNYSKNIAVICENCGYTMLFNADVLMSK